MNAYVKARDGARYVRDEYRRFSPLAQNLREQASILGFFLEFGIANFLPPSIRPEDTTVRLRGGKYSIGLSSSEIETFLEVYRDRIYDKVHNFVPCRGWTVIDVGANVGLFAVRQAQRGAYVFAFEPNRDCFRRLARTIVDNRLTDTISAFNYALGSRPGLGTMVVPTWPIFRSAAPLTVAGSVVPCEDPVSNHASVVRVTSLDHIVTSLGIASIDLLKIDVEGAEIEVLHGAAQSLHLVDRLIVEYHSPSLLEQVNALLTSNGFTPVLRVTSNHSADAGLLYAKRS